TGRRPAEVGLARLLVARRAADDRLDALGFALDRLLRVAVIAAHDDLGDLLDRRAQEVRGDRLHLAGRIVLVAADLQDRRRLLPRRERERAAGMGLRVPVQAEGACDLADDVVGRHVEARDVGRLARRRLRRGRQAVALVALGALGVA